MFAMASYKVLVEMSGDVVLNPDKNLAVTYLVDVEDPECHAFGCDLDKGILIFYDILTTLKG